MKQLTQRQWEQLDCQLAATPPLDDHYSPTGEHWMLIALLNQFGFNPRSREDVMDLAMELLCNGYIS